MSVIGLDFAFPVCVAIYLFVISNSLVSLTYYFLEFKKTHYAFILSNQVLFSLYYCKIYETEMLPPSNNLLHVTLDGLTWNIPQQKRDNIFQNGGFESNDVIPSFRINLLKCLLT